MQFVPLDRDAEAPSFEGFTLVLPAVSFGNVPQLCTDVLVCSLGLHKVGFLYTEHVLPAVCHAALAAKKRQRGKTKSELTLNLELFADEERRLLVLQQRAPVVNGHRRAFARELADWVASLGVARVLVLNSWPAVPVASAAPRQFTEVWATEEEMEATQNALGKTVECQRMPSSLNVLTQGGPGMAGWGATRALLEETRARGVRLVLLAANCSEGDNSGDGLHLAKVVEPLLKTGADWPETVWKTPNSWEFVFGAPPDVRMFE